MAWGEKPMIDNPLDKYIYNTGPIEEEMKKEPIVLFATRTRVLKERNKVMAHVKNCADNDCSREDIFYCIDNSGLGAFDKLLSKLEYMLYVRKNGRN